MEHENKPLTLEQLREAGRDPLYLEVLDPERTFIRSSGWCEIEMMNVGTDDEQASIWWPGNEVNDTAFPEDYGEVWLAYAQKPIDFEDWGPCPDCRNASCASCVHHMSSIVADPCSSCFVIGGRILHYEPLPFCPMCGRPLTPAARELVERRLRG